MTAAPASGRRKTPSERSFLEKRLGTIGVPLLDECLRWAIDSGQDAGVWGGMSEDERRSLKRRTLRLRARAGV